MSGRGDLTKQTSETLQPTEWVTRARVGMQQQVVSFLLWVYLFLLVSTVGMFVLQGFHAWGFNLTEKEMMWLGGATIGEIGGLLGITVRSLSK